MAVRGPIGGMLDSGGTIAMKRIQVAIYDAVKARLAIVLTLLSEPATAIRQGAAEVLGYLTEDRHQLVPILLDHAARETDAVVGRELCQSVKRLLDGPMRWNCSTSLDPIPMFYDLIFFHPHAEVRVAAAQAAVEMQPVRNAAWTYHGLWQEVTRLLLNAFLAQSQHLRLPDAYADAYSVAPLLRDLSRLDPEVLLAALTRPNISAEQAHLLAMAVMIRACVSDHVIADYWQEHSLFQGHDDRCFRYRPQSLIHERSPQRLDLVQALVDNPRVWEIPTTMFSARFGMPDSREALATWLAQHIPDR